MGSRLRPKPLWPPVLLKGGVLALCRVHHPLPHRDSAETSPGPWDSAPPLPSHAGASGAGSVDEPSLWRWLWHLAVRVVRATFWACLEGLEMERQLLIPACYSKVLALGPCWFFQTLLCPLEGDPSHLSSSLLCAP